MGCLFLRLSDESILLEKVSVDEIFKDLKEKDIAFLGANNLATSDLKQFISVFDTSYIPIMSLFFQYHIDYCVRAFIAGKDENYLKTKGFTKEEIEGAQGRFAMAYYSRKKASDYLAFSLKTQKNIEKATDLIRRGQEPKCDLNTLKAAYRRYNTEKNIRKKAFCVA